MKLIYIFKESMATATNILEILLLQRKVLYTLLSFEKV